MVSIVCDVYNHEPYLRDCLDGFVMQITNFNYEILIHDDCSTDSSVEIIKEYVEKYPHLFKPIYQKVNQYSQGISIWGKFQLPRAKGKYIALCEGDDYWTDPYKLQKQVDYLEQHSNIDLCCTASRLYKQKIGNFVGRGGTPLCEKYESSIQGYNDIFTATTLIRTEEYRKCYDELKSFLPQDLMIDTAYWYWFAYHNKVKYLDEETAVYRILENSACHTTDNHKAVWMLWRFLRLKLIFLMRYPLRNNQDEVTKCILSEIEKYVQFAQHTSEENVRQSKTYRIGQWLKRFLKRR